MALDFRCEDIYELNDLAQAVSKLSHNDCIKLGAAVSISTLLTSCVRYPKSFYGMGGGVRQSIGYKDIRNMYVPCPSHKEQDQIVRYLEWQTSKINRLIAAKKQQIQVLREQQQKLICEVITKAYIVMLATKTVISLGLAISPATGRLFAANTCLGKEMSGQKKVWKRTCQ